MRTLLAFIFLLSITSYAKCAPPRFQTECVSAKVLKTIEAEKDISSRKTMDADPKWDWTCRRQISFSGYEGEVYIISQKAECPAVDKEILGDLHLPCNDAGQRTPVYFQVKTKKDCSKK